LSFCNAHIISIGMHFLLPRTFVLCHRLGHACSVYLLWWLLLGRYLKGVTLKCPQLIIPKLNMVSEQVHPYAIEPNSWFILFDRPDWCNCFPDANVIISSLFYFLLYPLLCHAWSLYLLWWLLLGRYLNGVTFKCIPSDYTKTEYGFWANPAIPPENPIDAFPILFDLTDAFAFFAFLMPLLP